MTDVGLRVARRYRSVAIHEKVESSAKIAGRPSGSGDKLARDLNGAAVVVVCARVDTSVASEVETCGGARLRRMVACSSGVAWAWLESS